MTSNSEKTSRLRRFAGKPSFDVMLWVAGALWVAIMIVAIALFMFNDAKSAGQQFGLSILVVFAAGAVGATLGFLFGVPKSVPVTRNGETRVETYVPNSNLEQVSDWLTKILVGVGLLEFRQLLDAFQSLGTRTGGLFGDHAGSPGAGAAYGMTLIIVGSLTGFLLMYMWTRTRLYEVLAGRKPPVPDAQAGQSAQA
ncbi:hypothetical protein LFM09_07175 [Lentzea alba]|uniref:hypothetical protein n=1 Tax=Lentzea alba TaxID=2714351 RepID=UPI0039BF5E4D